MCIILACFCTLAFHFNEYFLGVGLLFCTLAAVVELAKRQFLSAFGGNADRKGTELEEIHTVVFDIYKGRAVKVGKIALRIGALLAFYWLGAFMHIGLTTPAAVEGEGAASEVGTIKTVEVGV